MERPDNIGWPTPTPILSFWSLPLVGVIHQLMEPAFNCQIIKTKLQPYRALIAVGFTLRYTSCCSLPEGSNYVCIDAYTVVLIWIGHTLFHEHTNTTHMVRNLELNILPKFA